ncbi:MAG: CIA30 family protein [Bacteroidota bacterium]
MKYLLILSFMCSMAFLSSEHYIDFDQEAADTQWFIVNDGVMGGLSQGNFTLEEDHGVFSGDLSLENNGGFSWAKSNQPLEGLSDKTKMKIRVKGDGRKYAFTVETRTAQRVAYFGAPFTAPEGEWKEIELDAASFRLNYFGRDMGETLETFDPAIRIGIILADKKQGAFKMEIDYVDMM